MRRILAAVVLLAVVPLDSRSVEAQEAPSAADIEAEQAVAQLGADEFAVREQAGRELLQMGMAARPALISAQTSDDPEIRIRSGRLLAAIERNDLRARLQAFIADDALTQDHRLPGWERFRDQFGAEKAARSLFVEMQQSEPELMRALEQDARLLGERFQSRCAELQQQVYGPFQRQIELGSVTALLFIGGDENTQIADEATLPIYQFVNQSAFQQMINGGPNVEMARKLLASWVKVRTGAISGQQNMYLAMRYNLKEALAPALAMLERQQNNANQMHIALLAVGKLGSKDDLRMVQKAMGNRSICSTTQRNNKMIQTEVRDVALAVAIQLTGQSHKEYGFNRLQANPQILFNVHTLGFESKERREDAFEKWRKWAADHLPVEQQSPASDVPPAADSP